MYIFVFDSVLVLSLVEIYIGRQLHSKKKGVDRNRIKLARDFITGEDCL